MMRLMSIGLLAALAFTGTVSAQGWGTVKGQVIWVPAAGQPATTIPGKGVITPNKDQAACMPGGKQLIDDAILIDPKTKGVKDVMVWLAPLPDKKMPIHPDLKAVPKDDVVIKQPCCMFEPRITMMREGQTLIVTNTAGIIHNARISGKENGTMNLTVPAGQELAKKDLRAEVKPMLLNCDIHGWMKGRIGIFDHPYFALTKEDGTFEIKNAPAGKFKIFLQHEEAGWLHKTTGAKASEGQDITIKAGGTLDLKKIDFKIE